jgi:DNA repair ATPase RecN
MNINYLRQYAVLEGEQLESVWLALDAANKGLHSANERIANLENERESRRNDNIVLESIVRRDFGQTADEILTHAVNLNSSIKQELRAANERIGELALKLSGAEHALNDLGKTLFDVSLRCEKDEAELAQLKAKLAECETVIRGGIFACSNGYSDEMIMAWVREAKAAIDSAKDKA